MKALLPMALLLLLPSTSALASVCAEPGMESPRSCFFYNLAPERLAQYLPFYSGAGLGLQTLSFHYREGRLLASGAFDSDASEAGPPSALLTAGEAGPEFAVHANAGLRPRQLSVTVDPQGQARFTLLWQKSGTESYFLFTEMTDAEFERHWRELVVTQGYRIEDYAEYRADGERKHAAIFISDGDSSFYFYNQMSRAELQDQINALKLKGFRVASLNTCEFDGRHAEYAAVWRRADDGWSAYADMSLADFLQKAETLGELGYRPFKIQGHGNSDRFSAVWKRAVPGSRGPAAEDPGHSAPPPDCSREPGVVPDRAYAEGVPNPKIPIEHVVLLMQENRSFDHYFGHLNEARFYGKAIDGLSPEMSNPRADGTPVPVFHQSNLCSRDVEHGWDSSHRIWNNGANSGYVLENSTPKRPGDRAMGFYTDEDIPFYYDLANTFAIGDRHFASVLGPTDANRFYLLAGTSFGHIRNDLPKPFVEFDQLNIFDVLSRNGISWKYYFADLPYMIFFQKTFWRHLTHLRPASEFDLDLKAHMLPQVVFLETAGLLQSEHPPLDIQLGQMAVSRHVKALLHSKYYWPKSALFFTYDEGGGFFDHVSPPAACRPDDIPPHLKPGNIDAQFDRLGFRVPLIVVSPYARRHFVSHTVSDHTSLLAFLERKFNLPALSRRDANADPLLDYFDFEHPDFSIPKLAKARFSWGRLLNCFNPRP
jgi:phospholipase C